MATVKHTTGLDDHSPSRDLFAALAIECGWAVDELEKRHAGLVGACKGLMRRLEVNELLGRTDGLGEQDQAAYDVADAALAAAQGESS